ncbi:MAG: hypothetical protein HN350_15460, partial [Phycisphaerales bacterium]|nr:hypothetical protein [Phycisphaerales bacterium]
GVIGSAASSGLAQSDPRLGKVFYQVLGTDKQVRNLPLVPQSNKGIQSVLRIATPGVNDPQRRKAQTLSTRRNPEPKKPLSTTTRTQLTWDGKAWVASITDRRKQLATTLSTRDFNVRARRKWHRAHRHPMLRALDELQNQRAFWQMAAIDIEAKMFERAGSRSAGRKRWDLAAVNAIQRDIDISIDQHQTALLKMAKRGELGEKFKIAKQKQAKPIPATGKVVQVKLDPDWTEAPGIVKPITQVSVPAHRLQVWAAPPATGRRRCHVTMAHAEAGPMGAFYYVAYADFTGDGLPDTLIARSILAQSETPGQWTAWSFVTKARTVFIGMAWANADTSIYCQPAAGPQWRKLGRQAYISPVLGSAPRSLGGMLVTNARIYWRPEPATPTTQPAKTPEKPQPIRPKPPAATM